MTSVLRPLLVASDRVRSLQSLREVTGVSARELERFIDVGVHGSLLLRTRGRPVEPLPSVAVATSGSR